jgi:hypothetical protein
VNVIWQIDNSNRGGVKPREYSWICLLLENFDLTHYIDGCFEVIKNNPIIVLEGPNSDNNVTKKYFDKLSANNIPFGIIHIGDENRTSNVRPLYARADFVYRNYWRPEIDRLDHCHFLPLGPNCSPGLLTKNKKDFDQREFDWSFAGSIRPGPRRHLLNSAIELDRENGRFFATNYFNSGLSKKKYARLLCDSRIVLCPGGFTFKESYRFYEALEAGAIPLVEDNGGVGILHEHANWPCAKTLLSGGYSYWYDCARRLARHESYWKNAYSEFPCPRIFRWENLPHVLNSFNYRKKSSLIRSWWKRKKANLIEKLSTDVKDHLCRSKMHSVNA